MEGKEKAIELAEQKFREFEYIYEEDNKKKDIKPFELGRSLGKMLGAKYTWILLKNELKTLKDERVKKFHTLIDKSEQSDFLKEVKLKYKHVTKSKTDGCEIREIFRIKDNRSIATFVIIDQQDEKYFEFIFEALNYLELK